MARHVPSLRCPPLRGTVTRFVVKEKLQKQLGDVATIMRSTTGSIFQEQTIDHIEQKKCMALALMTMNNIAATFGNQ